MSEQPSDAPAPGAISLSIDQLIALQGAHAISDKRELLADVWESDEELDAFLVDLRSARSTSLS